MLYHLPTSYYHCYLAMSHHCMSYDSTTMRSFRYGTSLTTMRSFRCGTSSTTMKSFRCGKSSMSYHLDSCLTNLMSSKTFLFPTNYLDGSCYPNYQM